MKTSLQNGLGQCSSLTVAGIAAACCAGKVSVISALSALGFGAIIEHAYLVPLFVVFVSIQLWLLRRSGSAHGDMRPFYLGLAGGIYGSVSLWLNVTAIFIQPYQIYVTAALLLGALIWDVANKRRTSTHSPVAPPQAAKTQRLDSHTRVARGAALAVAAAGVFYGIHKSVDALAPAAEAGEIACWGVNACKGLTACSTAFNGCPGRNSCRGRGFLYVDANECWKRGGTPLEGSEADPRRRTQASPSKTPGAA